MAEHRLPPPPAPVAAPIVEHPAVEPLPVLEEPPAVDPVDLVVDPAPAVETVKEVIFLAILLVLSQVYIFYRVFPAACGFSAYVCLRFIYIFFLGSFVWVIPVNLYTPLKLLFSCSVLFSGFCFLVFLHASVALCCVFQLSQFRLSRFVFGEHCSGVYSSPGVGEFTSRKKKNFGLVLFACIFR